MQRWEREPSERHQVHRANRDGHPAEDDEVIDLTDGAEEDRRATEVDGRDFRILQRLRSRR